MERADIDEMQREHDRRQLELHKQYYERTSNPLWLYEALRYVPHGDPYPEWIDNYFRQSAETLRRLTFPTRRAQAARNPSAAAATARVPDALGFRRAPNWNAIEDRRLDNIRFHIFNSYAGTPPRRQRRLTGELAQELDLTKPGVRRLLKEAINLEKR
jgi:hypothetical protein